MLLPEQGLDEGDPRLRCHLLPLDPFIAGADLRHTLFAQQESVERLDELIHLQREVLIRRFQILRDILLRLFADHETVLLALRQIPGQRLERLVLQDAGHQFGARILRHDLAGLGIAARQEHAGLQLDQLGCEHHKFGRHGDVHLLHLFDVIQILRGDLRDADVVDVHPGVFDQIDKQIERPLEGLQFDLVSHGCSF